jgi:arylformamidase
MYNNRARVPETRRAPSHAGRATPAQARRHAPRASTSAMAMHLRQRDARHLPRRLVPDAPVLFFIHGGYGGARIDKKRSFLRGAALSSSAALASCSPTTRLCPGTRDRPGDRSLRSCWQMIRALAWTWRHVAAYGGDPFAHHRGRSLGGRASWRRCCWRATGRRWRRTCPLQLVRNALVDLGPARPAGDAAHVPFLEHDSLQSHRAEDADAPSPALWPAPKRGTLYTVAGAATRARPSFAQNADDPPGVGRERPCRSANCCRASTTSSIVEALADPAHALHHHAVQLLEA